MAMSSALFLDLSFTSLEIANISKAYGLLVMILGAFLGGILVSRLGIFKGIIICGCVQILSPLMFLLLSIVGHNTNIFITTITLQNFCCGLGGTALVIYFSTICSNEFIATQFAIIASFGSLVRISLSSISGFLASYCEWPQFFLFNTLLSILFIPIFLKAHKHKH
jgi:MFS family permease